MKTMEKVNFKKKSEKLCFLGGCEDKGLFVKMEFFEK